MGTKGAGEGGSSFSKIVLSLSKSVSETGKRNKEFDFDVCRYTNIFGFTAVSKACNYRVKPNLETLSRHGPWQIFFKKFFFHIII